MNMNMNIKSISEAVSDGRMSPRTAAAVGGGTAGGLILLLSLLALCCCWSKHYSKKNHPQVCMMNTISVGEAYPGDLIPKVIDGSM